MRKIFQVILGALAAACIAGGGLAIAGVVGGAREAQSIARAYALFGAIILLIGVLAGVAVWFARRRWWMLIVAAAILCAAGPVLLFGAFWIDMEKGEAHRRQSEAEVHSGRYHFGDQPALFAVAQAIAANNQEAIRAAAKAAPDLQAAGRDGATLLGWTVRETWQRRELVAAVKTLLALGADPNYTNGKDMSFALGYAVHGPAEGLRAMLEAGGNPNALNAYSWPLVFMRYKLGYYKEEELARLDLLLDHGANINAVVPPKESDCAGCTLLLYTTQNGLTDPAEYTCAQHLLEKGADPDKAGSDGRNFAALLAQHRQKYNSENRGPPPQFTSLWNWAQARGLVTPL